MEPIQLDDAPMPNRATRRAAGRRARKLAALSSGAVLAGSAGAAVMAVMQATPAGASTFSVINNNNAGAGSLRQAVNDAVADAEASEIVFASNVTGTITLTAGRLEVWDGGDLTVTGPGASVLTVNGNANDNIFYSSGDFGDYTLSISGLTLTNGLSDNDGGAIEFYDDGSGAQNLVLTNMVITGNHADDDGGGVYFYTDGDMTVTNTVISGNFADGGSGGGVYFGKGDALTVTGSTIAGNTADNDGGGIGFYGGNTLAITNSTVSGNTTNDDGGGLYFAGNSATIANSTFSGNSAIESGGAIALYSGDLTLLQSTISGNTAGDLADGLYLNDPDIAGGSLGAAEHAAEPAEAHGPGKEPKAAKVPDDSVGALDVGTVALVGTIISANPGTDIDAVANATAAISSTNSLWGTKGAGITITDVGGTINTSVPGLAALADNGGPTQTMALLAGSPAIDTGPTTVPSFAGNANDQRGPGFPRVINGRVDIGAYEFVLVVRFTG